MNLQNDSADTALELVHLLPKEAVGVGHVHIVGRHRLGERCVLVHKSVVLHGSRPCYPPPVTEDQVRRYNSSFNDIPGCLRDKHDTVTADCGV